MAANRRLDSSTRSRGSTTTRPSGSVSKTIAVRRRSPSARSRDWWSESFIRWTAPDSRRTSSPPELGRSRAKSPAATADAAPRQLPDRAGDAQGRGGPDEEEEEAHADDGRAHRPQVRVLDPAYVVRRHRDPEDAAVRQEPARSRSSASAVVADCLRAMPCPRARAARTSSRSLWFSMAATSLRGEARLVKHPAVRRNERDTERQPGRRAAENRVQLARAQGAEPRDVIGRDGRAPAPGARSPALRRRAEPCLRGGERGRERRPRTGRRTGERTGTEASRLGNHFAAASR